MKTLLALIVIVVLSGCDRQPAFAPDSVGPTLPSPGQYYDVDNGAQGPWLAVAENGIVNIACTNYPFFYLTTVGPCQGDARMLIVVSTFRGSFVSPDSAAGTSHTIYPYYGVDSTIALSGSFDAKWDGYMWHARAIMTATEGCRTARDTVKFRAAR